MIDFLKHHEGRWFSAGEISNHMLCNYVNVCRQLKRLRGIIRHYKVNEKRTIIKKIKGKNKAVEQVMPTTYYSIKIKDDDVLFEKCSGVFSGTGIMEV